MEAARQGDREAEVQARVGNQQLEVQLNSLRAELDAARAESSDWQQQLEYVAAKRRADQTPLGGAALTACAVWSVCVPPVLCAES